jgi:hypothetical protein
MPIAGEELLARQSKCGHEVARLMTLAVCPADALLAPGTAVEVADAGAAILAEARSAAASTLAGTPCGQRPQVAAFLSVRLARLRAAADQSAAAARRGDTATFHSSVHRFRVLAAALWTVHSEVTAQPAAVRSVARPGSRGTRS